MNRIVWVVVVAGAVLLSTVSASAQAAQDARQSGALSQKGVDRIVREVHHELVMLPFYGV